MFESLSEKKDMLSGHECICLETETNEFDTAKSVAMDKALEKDPGAQLLYWFDRDSSMCSPGVVCNGPKIPTWLEYAGEQCDIIPIGVNEGAYFFAFAGSNCRPQV